MYLIWLMIFAFAWCDEIACWLCVWWLIVVDVMWDWCSALMWLIVIAVKRVIDWCWWLICAVCDDWFDLLALAWLCDCLILPCAWFDTWFVIDWLIVMMLWWDMWDVLCDDWCALRDMDVLSWLRWLCLIDDCVIWYSNVDWWLCFDCLLCDVWWLIELIAIWLIDWLSACFDCDGVICWHLWLIWLIGVADCWLTWLWDLIVWFDDWVIELIDWCYWLIVELMIGFWKFFFIGLRIDWGDCDWFLDGYEWLIDCLCDNVILNCDDCVWLIACLLVMMLYCVIVISGLISPLCDLIDMIVIWLIDGLWFGVWLWIDVFLC